jgi:5'-3' exonuclease
MNKLVLIDGNAILHRAYHALPPLTTKNGELINAVYGFVSMLIRVINDLRPTHLAVCFDRPEPTFRMKEYKDYQAQRPEMDKELSGQIEKLHKTLDAFNIKMFSTAGYEADDLLGSIAEQTQNSNVKTQNKNSKIKIDETIIVTGDRDILQLVNDKVKVYLPTKGLSEAKIFGKEEVKEKMGVTPPQIVDYKALVGDQSDNYPGVTGIGPKTAINLLSKYKSKEGIYKNLLEIPASTREKLERDKKNADMSYKLATIVKDVPLEIDLDELSKWDMGSEEGINVFREFGFKTLLNRTMNAGKPNSVGNFKEVNDGSSLILKKNLSRDEVEYLALKIAGKIKNAQYAIRGTASLVLQGINMRVDDVDVVSDKETALSFNKVFKKEMIDEVKYSESDKFKSYFGNFNINNVSVEVMGEWEIRDKRYAISDKKGWGEMYDGSDDEVNMIEINGAKVRVTKPETELKMFAQMQRWTAYQKIKKQIDSQLQNSLF